MVLKVELDKLLGKVLKGILVEVVLMGLHVTELGELLVTVVQNTNKWLQALVRLLVRLDITPLGECLVTFAALERLVPGVAALMSLQVAQLGEGETASSIITDIWS